MSNKGHPNERRNPWPLQVNLEHPLWMPCFDSLVFFATLFAKVEVHGLINIGVKSPYLMLTIVQD